MRINQIVQIKGKNIIINAKEIVKYHTSFQRVSFHNHGPNPSFQFLENRPPYYYVHRMLLAIHLIFFQFIIFFTLISTLKSIRINQIAQI